MTALSPGPNYASKLNYDCLLRIFEQLAQLAGNGDEPLVGGALYGWDSTLVAGPCVSVCRQWRAPAEKLIYRSCIIISSSSATNFLRTFAERPELAVNVRSLVVGLSYAQTYPNPSLPSDDCSGATQAVSSAILVKVVAACPQLMHLEIRPLHASCRSDLLPAVLSKPLVSLICCPHLPRANVDWTECFYKQSDFIQVFPSMPAIKNLEIDTWISNSEPMEVTIELSFPLVTLRLRVNICESQLLALLTSQGQVLEELDLYFERTMGTDAMEAAFLGCAATLKNVAYCFNPSQLEPLPVPSTIPLFTRLWPHLRNLEQLEVTATDIASEGLLENLPPSLHTLVIQAFNDRGSFSFDEGWIQSLMSGDMKKLKVWTIRDSQDSWREEDLLRLKEAAATRGIVFAFESDEERLTA